MRLSVSAGSKRDQKKARHYQPFNPRTGENIPLVISCDTANGVYLRFKPGDNGRPFLNAKKTEIVKEVCHGPIRLRRVV